MKTKTRQGLDMLMADYEDADIVRIETQEGGIWTLVDLRLCADQSARWYAILHATGNVYKRSATGAVDEDDPILSVTPLNGNGDGKATRLAVAHRALADAKLSARRAGDALSRAEEALSQLGEPVAA